MVVLYVILAIVLLFVLILSMYIKVYISLYDEFRLRVGLGPIVITLVPAKPRKEINLSDFTYEKHQKRLIRERQNALRKAEKSEKKRKARELAKDAAKNAHEEAVAGESGEEVKKFTLESIIEIIEFALDELPQLSSHIRTNIRMMDITVSGRDAADCATKYGIIAQLVSYLLALLDNSTSMKPLKADSVSVKADFLASKTLYRLDIGFKLRLFEIARAGVHTLVWLIKSRSTYAEKKKH